MPAAASACSRPATVSAASARRDAFNSVTFSRASRPIMPSSLESVTATSGVSAAKISAARRSAVSITGEKQAVTATPAIPAARVSAAIPRIAASSSGAIGRLSISCPPWTRWLAPSARARRSSGQSAKGATCAAAGSEIRSAITGARRRCSITAFRKWVVPIITASMSPGGQAAAASRA